MSQELILKYPNFAGLVVYGTSEEPLFSSQQVCEMLGIATVKFARDYKLGTDYIYQVARSKDGKSREQIMLTEQGFYSVSCRSRTKSGVHFRTFVCILLKDLRMRGMVRIDEIINKMSDCMKDSHIVDHLYFITDGVWTKIGRSCNVDERLKQLQTSNPLTLKVLRIFEGKGKYEKLVHLKADLNEHRGEWFKLTNHEDVYKWVDTLK